MNHVNYFLTNPFYPSSFWRPVISKSKSKIVSQTTFSKAYKLLSSVRERFTKTCKLITLCILVSNFKRNLNPTEAIYLSMMSSLYHFLQQLFQIFTNLKTLSYLWTTSTVPEVHFLKNEVISYELSAFCLSLTHSLSINIISVISEKCPSSCSCSIPSCHYFILYPLFP